MAGTVCAVFALLALIASAAEAAHTMDWATYQNPRYGFSIAYPPGLFHPVEDRASDSGKLLATQDGRARLLVGVLENSEGLDLSAYRELVKRETYPGASFDYAPVARTWFVLSGRRGDQHFYQWVSLVCGGRLIQSWAMTYPDAERQRFDPIVEAVARSYRPVRQAASICP